MLVRSFNRDWPERVAPDPIRYVVSLYDSLVRIKLPVNAHVHSAFCISTLGICQTAEPIRAQRPSLAVSILINAVPLVGDKDERCLIRVVVAQYLEESSAKRGVARYIRRKWGSKVRAMSIRCLSA